MAAYGALYRSAEFLPPSGLMAIGDDGDVAGETVSPGFARSFTRRVHPGAAAMIARRRCCRIAGTSMGMCFALSISSPT